MLLCSVYGLTCALCGFAPLLRPNTKSTAPGQTDKVRKEKVRETDGEGKVIRTKMIQRKTNK